ncbi:MAG TPA: hypothetical protein VFV85_03890, partial [Conexibacter sp.]|nr:hypothetical protein [Conexibacter sp.]
MRDQDPPATPRPSRPLPVERAEAELLAGRAQAVAKGWLLTLLERAPLDAVAAIPAAELAAEGPAVCAACARALGDDAQLARLRPEGDLAPLARRVGALAGARDAAAVLAAVDALRACLWAAALDARGARADDPGPLAERLAEVALIVGSTALGAAGAAEGGDSEREGAAGHQAAHADADRAGGAGDDDSRGWPAGSSPATGPARSSAQPEPEHDEREAAAGPIRLTGPGSV